MANKYSGTKQGKFKNCLFGWVASVTNTHILHRKQRRLWTNSSCFWKQADNEKEHAKMWFKELNGIGTTAESCFGGRGRKFWMDRYMPSSQKLPKKKAFKDGWKVPYGSRNRKNSRRTLPCIASQRWNKRGFWKEWSQGWGVP